MSIIKDINLKFTSGNDVPVTSATLSNDEWKQVKAEIKRLTDLVDGKWISVDTKLPEFETIVIVNVDRSGRSKHDITRCDYRRDTASPERNHWMQTRGDEKITAWQPLPPVKGKQ